MGSVPIMTWNPANRLDPLYDAEDATQLPVQLVGGGAGVSLVYPRGQVLGEVIATPGVYAPYDDAAVDGRNNARMILRYRTTSIGAGAGQLTWVGGEWGTIYSPTTGPAFKSGDFDLSQIVGLDANGLEDLNAHIIEGALGVNEVNTLHGTATGGTFTVTIPAVTVGAFSYPAVTVTGLAFNITAAAFVTAVNAALLAAGVPGTVTATGGALGTADVVGTFHGALGGVPFIATIGTGALTGGTVTITRTTPGVAPFGVIRLG